MKIDIDENPGSDQISFVADRVRAFNRQVGGHEPPRPVAVYLRSREGEIVGAAIGELWGQSVHVAAMWVDESIRGKGHGDALLRELEQYAVAHGCRLAYVETLSYQARPFYEKAGYRIFGELDGIAEGCTYYFLRKDLETRSPQG